MGKWRVVGGFVRFVMAFCESISAGLCHWVGIFLWGSGGVGCLNFVSAAGSAFSP